jgi:SWI/SNF-related matrix-associated actin-dependent regulator 1 of chromatin subfamily A
LFYDLKADSFFCFPKKRHEVSLAKKAGFKKDPHDQQKWKTKNVHVAADLMEFAVGNTEKLIRKRLKKLKDAVRSSRKVHSNFNVPVPKGLEYKPFQKAGIEFSVQRTHTLNADDMRLGKTIQAIGHINYKYQKGNAKILVICPATLKLNWQAELVKWIVNKRLKISVVSPKKYRVADIVIVNYDLLIKWGAKIKKRAWDLLICDEAHALKNKKAKRTQIVFGNSSRGRNKKWPIECHNMILLTGSPIVNWPIELFTLLKALKVDFAQDYDKFVDRYMEKEFNGFGYKYTGSKNLNELQQKLRETVMIRRRKAQVFKDLAERIRQIILVPHEGFEDLLAKENKVLHLTGQEAPEEEYRKMLLALNDPEGLAELPKLRHEIALRKIPFVVKHCEMILETEDKIVVYAHHVDVIKELQRQFQAKKYNPIVLAGFVKIEERMALVNKFNEDPSCRVCVIGIMLAQGMSLAASDIGVFLEIDWVPGNMNQAEDRLFHMTKKNPLLIQHIVIDGSVDTRALKVLFEKQQVIDKALDNQLV